jgi:hypothetical protein
MSLAYFGPADRTSLGYFSLMSVLLFEMIRPAVERYRGILDYYSRNYRFYYPSDFALNGQVARLEMCRQLIVKTKPKRIIETGTYRGTTAQWFAQFGIPLLTCEISQRFYEFSKRRLKRFKNVEARRIGSVEFLFDLQPSSERVLFYLDALGPTSSAARRIRNHL